MKRRKTNDLSKLYGPESFAASIVGMACISLPYALSTLRAAWWLIFVPLVIGIGLLVLNANIARSQSSMKRIAVGLLVASAGFALSLLGLLTVFGIASIFQN